MGMKMKERLLIAIVMSSVFSAGYNSIVPQQINNLTNIVESIGK